MRSCPQTRTERAGYTKALLVDEDVAQGVVQEKFLLTFAKLEELERPDAFGSWLKGIIRRLCFRIHRRRREVDTVGPTALLEITDTIETSAELSVRNEVATEVKQAIASLPRDRRALSFSSSEFE